MTERLSVVVPAYNEADTIGRTLEALAGQERAPDHVVVVDNGSTDDTAQLVKDRYPDVHLVHEPQKGTGAACSAGFAYAIEELGSRVIARTDADTVPLPSWTRVADEYFAAHPNKQLIGGTSVALRDEHYRTHDGWRYPLALTTLRFPGAVINREVCVLRLAAGHNMAVRAGAYEATGGFPASTIDSTDEDYELVKAVAEQHGFGCLAVVRGLKVATSMRRVRKVGGHIASVRYYGGKTAQERAQRRAHMTGGQIDVR